MVQKLLRITDEMAARIARARFDLRIQSEAETIRMLLTFALDALEAIPAGKPGAAPLPDTLAAPPVEAEMVPVPPEPAEAAALPVPADKVDMSEAKRLTAELLARKAARERGA